MCGGTAVPDTAEGMKAALLGCVTERAFDVLLECSGAPGVLATGLSGHRRLRWGPLRDRVLEELSGLVNIEAPESLVGQEVESRLHDLMHRLQVDRCAESGASYVLDKPFSCRMGCTIGQCRCRGVNHIDAELHGATRGENRHAPRTPTGARL